MGKKSRRNKAAKPPRAPDTPDTADDQDWWINGKAVPEADFVARAYEEIVSDPNHNDYPLAERHAAAGLAPLKRRPERVKKRRPSCDVCGARELWQHLESKLGVRRGGTTADGRFTLKSAECLASCGTAPVMLIDNERHENLSMDQVDEGAGVEDPHGL